MNVGDTANIQLLLSLPTTTEDLKKQITAAGEKVGATIRVSDVMEARLTGQTMEITASTPEQQAISATQNTTWSWDVRPTMGGKQQLHLTLSAIIEVDGARSKRAIRTFDRTINVQVGFGQGLWGFIKGNWQWLWATILVPLAAWAWKKRRAKGDLGT